MDCKCVHGIALPSIVILVFAIWPTQIVSAVVSRWIVIIAAVLILLGTFCPYHGGTCEVNPMIVKAKKKIVKKKRR